MKTPIAACANPCGSTMKYRIFQFDPNVAGNLPYDGFPKPSLQWLYKPNGLYLEFTKREI
jgi:hypothetical protein